MGKSSSSVKRNYLFKLSYQILSIFVPLITAPYVSRILEADGIGVYSYVSSIITYFTMFAALGTVNYGTREIAQNRDDKSKMSSIFWEIEIMTIFTTSIATVAWLILTCLYSQYTHLCLVMIPTIVAVAADISWLYTGLEQIQYTVSVNLLCKVIGAVFIFAFVKDKNDLFLYAFIISAVACLGNFSMWLFLFKIVDFVELKKINIFKHLRETIKYFITSIAISIYTVLDKTMIGVLTNNAFENGYYEQACKIINMVKPLAFTSINDVMAPRMSYLFSKKLSNEIVSKINTSLDIELAFSVGSCFGILVVAKRFVPIFFGAGYESVSILLIMMAPILVPICISTCIGSHYFLPSGNILQGTKLTIVGSIVNIIVNAPLIYLLGARGAVVASVLAEGVIAILYVLYCKKAINSIIVLRKIHKKIVAGIVMLLACSWIGRLLHCRDVFVVIIQVLIGMFIYFFSLLVLKDDVVKFALETVKGFINKRNIRN